MLKVLGSFLSGIQNPNYSRYIFTLQVLYKIKKYWRVHSLCCPVRVPQTMGMTLPVGVVAWTVSPLVGQLPTFTPICGGAAVTRLSKSSLIWHRSAKRTLR